MIKNSHGDLYVGITDNPERRLKEHNTNTGAKFTKGFDPFRIVFLEKHQNLLSARKREVQIKKWRREKKENLINLYYQNISTN